MKRGNYKVQSAHGSTNALLSLLYSYHCMVEGRWGGKKRGERVTCCIGVYYPLLTLKSDAVCNRHSPEQQPLQVWPYRSMRRALVQRFYMRVKGPTLNTMFKINGRKICSIDCYVSPPPTLRFQPRKLSL